MPPERTHQLADIPIFSLFKDQEFTSIVAGGNVVHGYSVAPTGRTLNHVITNDLARYLGFQYGSLSCALNRILLRPEKEPKESHEFLDGDPKAI